MYSDRCWRRLGPLSMLPLLVILAATSGPAARAEPWPMIDHDAAHTSFGGDPLPVPLVLMWTARLPVGTRATGFALDQGAVYVLGNENASSDPYRGTVSLFIFDAQLGRPIVTAAVGTGRAGAPAISGGGAIAAVFGGAGGGFLSSYALTDGKLLARAAVPTRSLRGPPAPPPSPLVSTGRIWLPGADGTLSRWDAVTLAPLPPLATGLGAPGGTSPVDLDVSDEGVDAIEADNNVAGQAPDGSFWRLTLEGSYPLPPAVIGPYLFLPVAGGSGAEAARLYTLDPSTGQVRWSAPIASPEWLAADWSRAYVADAAGTVQAFDEATGALVWTWRGGAVPSGGIVSGGRVVTGDASGALHALDSATGDEVWSFPTDPGTARRDLKFHLISAAGSDSVGDVGTFLYALREDGLLLAFRQGLYGDLNGDGAVGIGDAAIALRSVVGLTTLTRGQAASADVAPSPGPGRPVGDGIVDLHDVLSILRKAVGLEPASWPFLLP